MNCNILTEIILIDPDAVAKDVQAAEDETGHGKF